MQAKLLTGAAIGNAIERYMAEYNEYHWAVAWATSTWLSSALFENKGKIQSVTFGIDFAQTAPEVIEQFISVSGVFVASEFSKGTYHPKVYGFRSGDKAAVIVGSANFTNGALTKNLEACISLVGSIHDEPIADVFAFIEVAQKYGRPITKEFAAWYRVGHNRIARLAKAPRNPLANLNQLAINGFTSGITQLNWDEYVIRVKKNGFHDIQKSLKLLMTCQQWFASVPSFANLRTAERKAIAGILGEYQKEKGILDQEWGWFGSMTGSGYFANLIDTNSRSISKALDAIPNAGPVSVDDYDRFCDSFLKAFAGLDRKGGVPTASRLLAMKRPDTFLCVCKPNIAQASKDMGFSKSTLDLSNYWDRVVEVIRACEWYNVSKPATNGRLWEFRAAMLDAIYYQP